MDLVRRGRLSVQRVTPEAYSALFALAEQGGWDDIDIKIPGSGKAKAKAKTANDDKEEKEHVVKPPRGTKTTKKSRKGRANVDPVSGPESSPLSELEDDEEPVAPKKATSRKRKVQEEETKEDSAPPRRRSRRIQQ